MGHHDDDDDHGDPDDAPKNPPVQSVPSVPKPHFFRVHEMPVQNHSRVLKQHLFVNPEPNIRANTQAAATSTRLLFYDH